MEYFLGFVLLLGVLIFIHEFGHFIIAKACGVRVDTFSIGMGKKFIHFKKGETEYALSLLPLGGYVKLLGQDPREEVPPELEAKSFRHKPLWKRAAIVLAGPFFNAALAVIVFIGLYAHGVPTQDSVLARVLPESPAEVAGFRTGDKITSIQKPSGESIRIRELPDLEQAVGELNGVPATFHVQRAQEGGAPQEVQVQFTPVLGSERDSSVGVVKERGTLAGAEYVDAGSLVNVDDTSWAAQHKVPSSLWIEELAFTTNGIERSLQIESWTDLERAWTKLAQAVGSSDNGKITVKGRVISPESDKIPENTESYQVAWNNKKAAPPATLDKAGMHSAELALVDVKADSPAAKLGLKAGDRIVKLNGKNVYSFQSFRNLLQKEASSGHELTLGWFRGTKFMESSVKPELVMTQDPMTEAKKNQFQIGGKFLPTQAQPPKTVLKGESIGDTLALGWTKTVALTKSMIDSFYLLAKGEISPKTLGGPILIGKIAGESFKAGPLPFFKMMAFISMNLCILNLLPIPVLDGGHLVLYCIEALRRKPLSLKIVEAWTTAGFFFLMGLIAIVFFNDLSRLGLFKIFKS